MEDLGPDVWNPEGIKIIGTQVGHPEFLSIFAEQLLHPFGAGVAMRMAALPPVR